MRPGDHRQWKRGLGNPSTLGPAPANAARMTEEPGRVCVHCRRLGRMTWSPTMRHWHCTDPRPCLSRRGL